MGFLDALLGRTKVAQPDLNHLFSLSGAAISLQAAEGLAPTLRAGVCFKAIDDPSFSIARTEITELLAIDGTAGEAPAEMSETTDTYGYNWMVIHAVDFDTLVTRVHYVNSTLSDHGYGSQLLCSVFGFGPENAQPVKATTYLVYLFKQGTFYPFVPFEGQHRSNEVELRIKNELAKELNIEPQLDRWFPMWDMPL